MKDWTRADIEALQAKNFLEIVSKEAKTVCKKTPTRKAQPEYKIQAAFVKLMAQRHPTVLVFSDTAAHIKKTQIQQVRANALSSPNEKQPDVFIAKPCGKYHGVFFEFKAESPYLKDGVTLKKNPHVEAQAATMAKLEKEGYFCAFVWSAEMAVGVFEKLLKS